jgi:hypothetical protein
MPTLDFKGKQFVYSHHPGVPFRELQVAADKPLPAKSHKPSLDDNLIIHGDNFEALKTLLPTPAGKIDCIFIDPPYNTGSDTLGVKPETIRLKTSSNDDTEYKRKLFELLTQFAEQAWANWSFMSPFRRCASGCSWKAAGKRIWPRMAFTRLEACAGIT